MTKINLDSLSEKLETVDETNWNAASLEETIVAWLKADNKSLGDYLWPMRVALSGRKASPGPFEIASIIGKKETLAKIAYASSILI